MLKGRADGTSGGHGPNSRGPVHAPGKGKLSVGAERHAVVVDWRRMTQRRAKRLSTCRVPELGRSRVVPRQDDPAIGAEGRGPAFVPRFDDASNWLIHVELPEPRREVTTRRDERLAVGAEGHGHDWSLVLQGQANWLAGERIPEPRRLVPASHKKKFSIGADRHVPEPLRFLHRR